MDTHKVSTCLPFGDRDKDPNHIHTMVAVVVESGDYPKKFRNVPASPEVLCSGGLLVLKGSEGSEAG